MWLVLPALAISLAYASLLYLFSRKYSKPMTILLFSLRTVVVAIVVMLFINPYIKQTINKIEQPIVILAQDNSKSIVLTKDSVFYNTKYPQLIDSIAKELEKDYDVETVSFGDQYTNISNALTTISRQYYKRNVGAVVLLSDGVAKRDGIYWEWIVFDVQFRIDTLVYDTIAYPSMMIKDVRYNKTVQANMLFPLRVTANANNFKGEDMNIVVKMDGNEVENAIEPVTSNRFSKTFDFNIDSGDDGVKNIEIFLTPVETHDRASQQSTAMRRIFITVTDKKYRILCLARAPHPDIAAIKSALDDHFEFDVNYNDDYIRANNDSPLREYDLVIMHHYTILVRGEPSMFIPYSCPTLVCSTELFSLLMKSFSSLIS